MLISHEVIVKLIKQTTTETGLEVKAQLDKKRYPLKIKETDAELKKINIKPHRFYGGWNYNIGP